jgi:uncharacterized protein YeaO (DUF488 family)
VGFPVFKIGGGSHSAGRGGFDSHTLPPPFINPLVINFALVISLKSVKLLQAKDMIKIKRAYEEPMSDDGTRFLVDRFWPRGVKKEALRLESWAREAAPSGDLCKWFSHDPEKWDEFQHRYTAELDAHSSAWGPILEAAREGTVTLIFSARDERHNNAVALKNYLDAKLS